MDRLAFSHPGKIGDTIYALPTIKFICDYYKVTCDFYTSEYCKPLTRLFEYQSYIDKAIIPPEYEIERMDMGVQPWNMPIDPNLYVGIIHLGFRQVPDRSLHQFIAWSIGINVDLKIQYEYPEFETLDKPYIVIAPRGETTFKKLFMEVIEKSPIDVVSIGGVGEAIGNPTIDCSGLDMLETVTWISKSSGYVGLMSSQLALANGFEIPKVAPHDGKSWDMRHIINSKTNHYPINPTAEEIWEILQGKEN